MTYLTTTHFEFGSVQRISTVLRHVRISKSYVDTDTYIGLPFGHSGMGVKEEDIPGLIEYAMKGLSAATKPRIATEDDFEGMIRDSL